MCDLEVRNPSDETQLTLWWSSNGGSLFYVNILGVDDGHVMQPLQVETSLGFQNIMN